jgi:hypothetical protein
MGIMKNNKTYKTIKASERLPNYEDDFYTERGVIVFFPDQKAFGYYDKEYPDGPEEFIEVNIQYWLEEQEQEQENIREEITLIVGSVLIKHGLQHMSAFGIDAVQRAISESIIEYISQHPTEQPTNELSEEEYRTMLFERSQLFMPYGVKDKEGKFRDVVDVQTVIEIFNELKAQ